MEREETSTLMTTDDLVRHLRMSRVTIWRKRAAGGFPQPCALGGQLRWKRRDIDDWVAKLPTRDPVAPPPPPFSAASQSPRHRDHRPSVACAIGPGRELDRERDIERGR